MMMTMPVRLKEKIIKTIKMGKKYLYIFISVSAIFIIFIYFYYFSFPHEVHTFTRIPAEPFLELNFWRIVDNFW